MNDTRQKSQSQKFIDKARELGCDEDERAFERKLKQIAKSATVNKNTSRKKSESK